MISTKSAAATPQKKVLLCGNTIFVSSLMLL